MTLNDECRWTREYWAAYEDGELRESDRTRLEAHASRCPGCAAETRALRQAWLLFQRAQPREAPPEMEPPPSWEFPGAMTGSPPLGNPRPFWMTVATMLIFALFLTLRGRRKQPEPESPPAATEDMEWLVPQDAELTLAENPGAEPLASAWAREIGGMPDETQE